MTKLEYDKTVFYHGIQAKINNEWHPVVAADFETRETICIIDSKEKTFSVEDVQEFSNIKNIYKGGEE